MLHKIKLFFTDLFLLKKFFAVIFGLIVFRLIAAIPVPQIDISTISSLLSQNQILGVFNLFSGGGLSNISIAMLGVFPYITVSIIVQLLTAVVPQIHSLYHEQGEIGRRKITYWTRIATVPAAALNASGLLYYLKVQGVIFTATHTEFAIAVLFVVVGSMLSMWIGELITEFGIGNGISFIVFAGIVVNIPLLTTQAFETFSTENIVVYVAIGIAAIIGVIVAVWMNEADRPVPMTYARYGTTGTDTRRVSTYIPIKVNPVGVLPIIFSLTLLAAMQYVFSFLSTFSNPVINEIGIVVSGFLANGYYYAIPAALLTFFFTYFHAPLVLNTEKIADNIQKQGAFIPGVRPGDDTVEYFSTVLIRVLFYAAVFLAAIVSIPFLVTGSVTGTFLFAIGGSGLLIIVSVLLDVYRKTASRLHDLEELAI